MEELHTHTHAHTIQLYYVVGVVIEKKTYQPRDRPTRKHNSSSRILCNIKFVRVLWCLFGFVFFSFIFLLLLFFCYRMLLACVSAAKPQNIFNETCLYFCIYSFNTPYSSPHTPSPPLFSPLSVPLFVLLSKRVHVKNSSNCSHHVCHYHRYRHPHCHHCRCCRCNVLLSF